MAIMEILLFYDGMLLYSRKYQEIRMVQDDDVVAGSLHATFLVLAKNLKKSSEDEIKWKLNMSRNVLHLFMKRIEIPVGKGESRTGEIFIYIIEDKDMDEEIATNLLVTLLDNFLSLYLDRIPVIAKSNSNLDEYTKIVDGIIGKMNEKQYKKFFRLWNEPRMNIE